MILAILKPMVRFAYLKSQSFRIAVVLAQTKWEQKDKLNG